MHPYPQAHAQGGCRGSLRFSIENMYGNNQLLARCHTCGCLSIIV